MRGQQGAVLEALHALRRAGAGIGIGDVVAELAQVCGRGVAEALPVGNGGRRRVLPLEDGGTGEGARRAREGGPGWGGGAVSCEARERGEGRARREALTRRAGRASEPSSGERRVSVGREGGAGGGGGTHDGSLQIAAVERGERVLREWAPGGGGGCQRVGTSKREGQ
jgi:hypothetical protein